MTEGTTAEREAIVRWLRSQADLYPRYGWRAALKMFWQTGKPFFLVFGLGRKAIGWSIEIHADAIERGDHLKESTHE